ncbi:UDP-glucose 4-epimerase GalE [Methylophaga sp. OBS1]|uniref:UDP-glucose 4-epimerase GalE n=1 Tax=Methylophaga sp. OBS1 TaxID=2991933 RepID=UPI002259A9E4|nr:UDP-glucose 4-epimerase GalE [Methylophaga sp. OBS1]MCX4193779.1 UDP-glucose 4-epimerase GalE [Methylophaga sp. OBS1]
MINTVLVTGGTGYIGSHIAVSLLRAGLQVVIVDNLSNSSEFVIQRIARITGTEPSFFKADCRDKKALQAIFNTHRPDAVIHLAGHKAVGESCQKPLMYYQNNIESSLVLIEVMQAFSVDKLVFSSSATVYGDTETMPVNEQAQTAVTNPYGQTKLMIEQMLQDISKASPEKFKVALLRYFNPAGADESGLIGEDPRSIPNNLMPYVSQVAIGKRERLSVFGGDYPTADGTGVRDYIHVSDLAQGHLEALRWLDSQVELPCCRAINLGTGVGYSVLEVVSAFEQISGRPVPYDIVDRRPGDVAVSYADVSLAANLLDWRAEKDLEDMVSDAWRWQEMNPNGIR